ncbi:MAG: hypothetical protein M1837_005891 [Sclerophora amabilis]|nr:MAG: hypothetical protein M1837_005891 [Sclerophora amabilis]
MDSNDKRLPDLSELLTFDIVLFSRTRFEKEERDERMPNENVTSEPVQYNSPLKNIHWKRIIIDEGHSMGQAKTQALVMADKLIVENRWVVSGTPANSMIGVEVGMAANQSQDGGLSKSPNIVIAQALALRKAEESIMQDRKDLERIGVIATKFLKVRPWANSLNDDPASWARFITPRDVQSPGLSPLRATSYCLQATLESLIIKHRAEDVDVDLPPLNNKLVYLEPSFYDTLSINLFIQAIVANAITSEREDSDYLFHPKNRNELNRLVNNLRQSGFFWTGYSKEEVQQTMAVSQQYLDKEGTKCTQSDRQLLTEAVDVGHVAVADSGWTSFSHFHELGLSVAHFPNDTRTEWALDHCDSDPLLMGITQLLKAQKHVNSQLYAPDPGAGLAAVGKVAMVVAQATASKFNSQDSVKRLTSVSSSPVRIRPKARSKKPLVGEPNSGPQDPGVSLKPPAPEAKGKGLKSALKISHTPTLGLPQDSPLSKTCIVGVASSKLAYLIDRVLRLHRQEKILIAYEGEDVAFYIAQALEIVGVKHLIYATSLKAARRAQYIVTFNTTETFRVLLMDVHQASHGLNLSSASRVFFVNPVWQPNVEAQAIKRAHRIGQTRPVYVETLILKNTLDDKMLQRRRNMSHDEHERTQKSLLDDRAMTKMIQDLTFLPINTSKELSLEHKMAKLSTPHQVFGQVGWTHAEGDEGLIDVQSSGPTVVAKSKRKRVAVAFGGDEDLDTAGEPTNIGTEPRKVQRNAKSVMMGETDLIPNDRCNSSVVTESSLDPTSSHPATPTPRRARFALPNEEEVSGPSTETDSQLTSQPVRRSLFGGGGENSPEPSSGSMAARTPTSTTD